jgi:TetR/AcrR family transcriptional regulator, transcriptional repressor for nem operon
MMPIMRYPEGHKDEVRSRIIQAASEALRSHGIEGVGIPALMKRAGLTHGGFYSHFENRDSLVAEAITSAALETGDRIFAEDRDLQSVLDAYLSQRHLDHPAQGCVLAALGTDGARQPGPVRHAFAKAARGMLRLLQKKLHPEVADGPLNSDTLALASMMVGAVILGRLVDDAELAGRILEAARTPPAP